VKSWAAAAEALGMPGPMGVRCARACSATMLVTADEWEARIWRAIQDVERDDYRATEAKIRHRLGMSRWFDEWARNCRPGQPPQQLDLALTWQWVHVAHAHLDLCTRLAREAPTATGARPLPPVRSSLDDKQQLELAYALHKRA
jgi:hypothetical protein